MKDTLKKLDDVICEVIKEIDSSMTSLLIDPPERKRLTEDIISSLAEALVDLLTARAKLDRR